MRFFARLGSFGTPRLPAIIQSEAAECGLACLAMIATYHGREVDLAALRRLFSVSLKGVTLKDVLAMGQRLGLTGRGLRLEPEQLERIALPCILHWDMNHFVVLKRVGGRTITIHDPASGVRTLTLDEVGRRFTGIALELTPTASFERKKETSRLRLTALWDGMRGVGRGLAQALVLSAVLQAAVLAAPFTMQLAVDGAVMQGDQGLLAALALGFGLLTLIRIAADWLRSQVLLFLGGALHFRMGANLFHHLVRLPLSWFEKRHVGDLVSRFRSVEPVQRLVSDGLVAALVDGVTAILTLVVILVYSSTLSGIVLGALALCILLRLAFYRALHQRQEEVIEAAAREQTTFIETARAIQSIKIFGREADREALWQNRHAETISCSIRYGRFTIGFKRASDLIHGIENALVLYFGARTVMANELTIGMLCAFLAYKEQFLGMATNLIETGIQHRMLALHLDRLSDIALADREHERDRESPGTRQVAGAVDLVGVSFRYADTEPEVLSGACLQVAAGSFVAITGPSGAGKTTLLKIMLGLFKPTQGCVLIDGTPLEHFGVQDFRAQIGVVMQDDQLLSGSIAENISFFDANLDLAWARQCAAVAGIDDEIMGMPMNYDTLIGDMGTTLSGGQRQRVLLARALYRRPRMLFMDEGTSHLDLDKEREVNRALSRLKITRIVIAHRPETIRAADRIVVLRDGRLSAAMDRGALAFAEAARPSLGAGGFQRA
ncbi:peptidase domain-containing ABC transporter [Microvirga sp. CF3016]|uniref:peptidase domain-containing ABC transporter n=1 Tax=Microvirga sp. CF3016 TaxID=3110181 RepID=UPI002E794CEE|nr:peptidase domain-containing ABC transporter [Microvirga sp. CF3016]MEE1610897.1 peptidase domain-containing ABC transporter [Microvirga sp. CF3016]